MNNPPVPSIEIKAKASHHALFLLYLGAGLLGVNMLMSQYFWQEYRLILIFFIMLSLVITFTGLLKCLEPAFSFTLTPQAMIYHHRHGNWRLSWQQIQVINNVKENSGFNQVELPYIGIKLTNLDELIEQISPRMANRLIHEQRPLISFAVMNQLLTLEQAQMNFSPYQTSTSGVVKGPLAGFLHHSQVLYSAFGYHLFIPDTSVDRDLVDFCQLLKRCKLASINYSS